MSSMPRIETFERYTSRYENWFEENRPVYESELGALRANMPPYARGLEIGVGSGRFAVPLGILFGVDPSPRMANIARNRGIQAVYGVAEQLPFADSSFDLALIITTICFLDDIKSAFREVKRILDPGGSFIIGFIDKNSSVGRSYQEKKKKSVFYEIATFYSVEEVVKLLKSSGFDDLFFTQTLFRDLKDVQYLEPVVSGHGKGSFVVVRAVKQ
ncbi:Methyltransferase domain-containing protein [Methanococcoides vulcani]|uniref:Methyltransferase domain-containing protein n=1 Tax=Methanococcoides vulcani TaxID=1353158 RepID=A0A1H9YDS1_9EURY|nr:class I SAM-dependent methyltransferase [Methanococcoides vulcani]SES67106.1 Methyltransferase domain-containing protein [Methanococcoides vulcani]